ncbi:NUDIX domain-containing protein [Pseudohoeflea suaedae]|uniref:NUDIX domain-containing protein n=1 Tax=Pseudohoeflea suaedae TaxID=877384 RepID=A0A4R5PKE6_9HYPH|nr:NUDIX domain-containing protein [Pseudohoeflea suaedae]TDH35768.1 NUDIX domain-containing protein [Pseudohoeflea suaedae]
MDINIAAAAIMRPDGATLLVRKRGTTAFMQPGGKIAPDESAREALCRELAEELGLTVLIDAPVYIGRFSAPAANEAGSRVVAELFRLDLDRPVQARAEIEETLWLERDMADGFEIAPLTRTSVLPAIWG